MSIDLFNNPSNDYVYPALSPCAGAGDSMTLEFLPNDAIGIVQGSNVLESLSFASLKIPVTAFNSFIKTLQPGEVIFIPGLTKGLQTRTQGFTLPNFTANNNNPFFMSMDLSIYFYKNFKSYNLDVEASANFSTNIPIDAALNLSLNNAASSVTSNYDPSTLLFTGSPAGYNFSISNVILTLIDASENINSPFPSIINASTGQKITQLYNLPEDLSKSLTYAKYPNTAIQGIIMQIKFPADSGSKTVYDEWVYINHPTDPINIYDAVDVSVFVDPSTWDPSTYYTKTVKTLDVGLGVSTPTVISAGDYLTWVQENNLWFKVGQFYAWTTAPDFTDTENLIDGFYIYNPHDFPVQISYMVFI